jgi:osmotically inducible lipoprotein OsmB
MIVAPVTKHCPREHRAARVIHPAPTTNWSHSMRIALTAVLGLAALSTSACSTLKGAAIGGAGGAGVAAATGGNVEKGASVGGVGGAVVGTVVD